MNAIKPLGISVIDSATTQQINENFRQLAVQTGPAIVSQDYTFRNSDTIDSLQVDATAGNITITLPSPTGNRRRRVIKTDASSNTVTIAPSVGVTINSDSSYKLFGIYRFVEVEPTGANWIVVAWGSVYVAGNGDTFNGLDTLATTATSGFLYIPTCSGTPTGTPVNVGSYSPLVVDKTNNKLYFYSSGAWRDAGP